MSARALIAEPSLPIANALKLFLTSSGFEAVVCHSVDDAVLQARRTDFHAVFASVSGSFDGEALCGKLKHLKPHLPVVLIYPPTDERAGERSVRARAAAWLIGPLKKNAVVSTMRSMLRQHELTLKLESLEVEVTRLRSTQGASVGANTHDAGFFKKYLLLEVKRSRRYHYPVAFLLVGLDRLEERLLKLPDPDYQRAAIRAESLSVIGQLIRDIDLSVPFADDRYLVFLPHTAREGALTVAGRLVARLGAMKTFDGGSASVGMASVEPKKGDKADFSFGSLMKAAGLALKRAQTAGGGRVEATSAAPPAKRSRISMM